ncbi:MAG: hypothetical protein Q8K32_31365 [Archangium sp.]|nr:hypothetical protein [Archangium sp.]
MSNASTNNQAFREYVKDLQRINPKRDDFLAALADGSQKAVQKHQKLSSRIQEAAQSYLTANKAQVEAHIDAELLAIGEE